MKENNYYDYGLNDQMMMKKNKFEKMKSLVFACFCVYISAECLCLRREKERDSKNISKNKRRSVRVYL